MRYIGCLLGLLLTLDAVAQWPARRNRPMQEVVIDTSRWRPVKIAPKPRARPVPMVFTPAQKDSMAAIDPDALSPLASLIAHNDSVLAATKPETVTTTSPAPVLTTAPVPMPTITPKPATVTAPASTSAVAPAAAPKTAATPKPAAAPRATAPAPGLSATKASVAALTASTAAAPVSKPAPVPAPTPVQVLVPEMGTMPASATKAPQMLTFSEKFDNNNNAWLEGSLDNYTYELAPFYNSYFIRREGSRRSGGPGRAYVSLPAGMDLSRAESFTISVDMIAPKTSPFDAGLVFGALDERNYCHFQLKGTTEVSIKSVFNGSPLAKYMPGQPVETGVVAQPLRNTLTVAKENNKLHFYVNGQEVQTSPYEFRSFRGNKIGLVSGGEAIKFQNLTVTATPVR